METKTVQISSITKFSQFEKERYSPYPSRGNGRGNGRERGRGRGRGRRLFGRGGYNGQPPAKDSNKPAGQEPRDKNTKTKAIGMVILEADRVKITVTKVITTKVMVPNKMGTITTKMYVSVDSVKDTK
eukprot:Pgem_evm1s8178